MDAALRTLLNATLSVRRVSSYSNSGTEVLGVARTVPAYVELRESFITAADGTMRRTTHLLVTEAELTVDDRITFGAAGIVGRKPAAIGVYYEPETSPPVVDHYEVKL